jgi:anti-sigma regulatory factor (Ser/Thr protein kinase)/ActR/RegA family two-component response regulator
MNTAVPPEIRPASSKTALVVDADPQVEAILDVALDPRHWNIQHASDNAAALAVALARPCEFVLTSEKTSGKEDVELLRKIRRVRPHTRLIILTNEITPADVLASMREHAFSYFSRPLSYETLAYMIQLAAEGPCWDDGIEILSSTPAWIRLAARCDLGTAERLVQFINEVAELPAKEKEDVAIAFREVLLNAIEHGGRFDPNQHVEVAYLRARHMVICRVKDPGQGFSLEEMRHTAMANPPEDPLRHAADREIQGLRPGGYGVLMARHFVDDLIYDEKGNDVVLIKYLQAPSESQS